MVEEHCKSRGGGINKAYGNLSFMIIHGEHAPPLPSSVVVETFPRPQYLLKFLIVRYIKIPTTEAIESYDLNIEN